jgi:hypothetical protein
LPNASRPTRFQGVRFGYDGELCDACRSALIGSKRRDRPVTACGKCGTRGGVVAEGRKRPWRYNARRYGFEVEVCHDCYHRLRLKHPACAGGRYGAVADPTVDEIARMRREVLLESVAASGATLVDDGEKKRRIFAAIADEQRRLVRLRRDSHPQYARWFRRPR